MLIYYLRDFVACFGATIFYCIIMSLPKKALWMSSLSSALTYIIYRVVFLSIDSEYMGYLAASCFAALSAEVLARACKMPATIFIFPAVIPLVPGLGLYRTMLCLVQSDMNGFASEGTKTLIISGIIAVTVAVVNAFFRNILKRKQLPKKE
ncbi:MAG: threonine/serine exporter family protein [Clostridia bacterium]|nr:threonine/serine exporter family protein [Clostridia bacterium]